MDAFNGLGIGSGQSLSNLVCRDSLDQCGEYDGRQGRRRDGDRRNGSNRGPGARSGLENLTLDQHCRPSDCRAGRNRRSWCHSAHLADRSSAVLASNRIPHVLGR